MNCVSCGNTAIENKDTMLCASCAAALRKRERQEAKPKKVYQIKRVSDKEKHRLKAYKQRRKKHLTRYPNCQLKLDVCTGRASQIHHVSGRIGSNLTNTNTFKSACDSCHKKLHAVLSAKERRERGLLK